MSRSAPCSAGSVSLRMYPHPLAADEIVSEMRAQARVAEASGFDGVMTSEHHGGFPGYLPNPLGAAGWLLDATRTWIDPAARGRTLSDGGRSRRTAAAPRLILLKGTPGARRRIEVGTDS